jgi:alpha-amylase
MVGESGHSGNQTRRAFLKGIGALTTTAIAGSTLSGQAAASVGDSAVYQYYHTDWETIRENLSTVADAGYDAIQVPPAQHSRLYEDEREFDEETYEIPLGYQPIDYRNFDSVFGTEDEYEAMVEAAHNQGLDVIADAVMNHMAAGGTHFERHVSLADIPQFSSWDFHENQEIDYEDPESVEDGWLSGLRDLKQESSYVRGQLYDYLEKYADLGVDGVRFDAAKHMPERFFETHANQWAEELGLYNVGEVLHGDVDVDQQYADTGMSVTDFALYYTMEEDVFHSAGDMRELEGAGLVNQDPMRALTFVSNHDEGPPEYERLAYAYILTYEGYPRVYNHRIGVDDDDISTLLSIRRQLLEGSATTRHVDEELYVYERGDALIVLNRGDRQRREWVETDFGVNERLKDVTDSVADTSVNDDGYTEVTAPAVGYAVYSIRELDDNGDSGDEPEQRLRVEAPTADDEAVYFTGNTDALTDWGSGVEGTESGGVWEVTVETTDDFEWKTRRGPIGDAGDVWEAGENHTSEDLFPEHQGWEDGFEGDGDTDDDDGDDSDDGSDDESDDSQRTPIEDGRAYVIRNNSSSLALDVEGVARENGGNVHLWEYEDGHQPHWIVESVGDGYYRLRATHSGKVLDVELGSTADGANVHQWDYVGNESQEWAFEEREDGYVLNARHSDKVLAATETENAANVEQQSESGDKTERWTLELL